MRVQVHFVLKKLLFRYLQLLLFFFIIVVVVALAIKKYTQHEINLIFRKVRTFWQPRIIQWM